MHEYRRFAKSRELRNIRARKARAVIIIILGTDVFFLPSFERLPRNSRYNYLLFFTLAREAWQLSIGSGSFMDPAEIAIRGFILFTARGGSHEDHARVYTCIYKDTQGSVPDYASNDRSQANTCTVTPRCRDRCKRTIILRGQGEMVYTRRGDISRGERGGNPAPALFSTLFFAIIPTVRRDCHLRVVLQLAMLSVRGTGVSSRPKDLSRDRHAANSFSPEVGKRQCTILHMILDINNGN